MDRSELVKLAYAYGASVALQEAGVDQQTAEGAGIKLADEAAEANSRPETAVDQWARKGLADRITSRKARTSTGIGALLGTAGGAVGANLLARHFLKSPQSAEAIGGAAKMMSMPTSTVSGLLPASAALYGGVGGGLLGGGIGHGIGRLIHRGKSKEEAAQLWNEMRQGKHQGIEPLSIKDIIARS